jgi:hypothetical protein
MAAYTSGSRFIKIKRRQKNYDTQELNRLNAKVLLLLYMATKIFMTLLNQLNACALSPPVQYASGSPL